MWFFANILGSSLFASMITRLVFVVLGALGIGFASFTGVDLLLDSFMAQINTQRNSLPAIVAHFLHLMGVDDAINIMFSASAAILTLKGIVGGKLTKFVTSGIK